MAKVQDLTQTQLLLLEQNQATVHNICIYRSHSNKLEGAEGTRHSWQLVGYNKAANSFHGFKILLVLTFAGCTARGLFQGRQAAQEEAEGAGRG